MKNILLTVSIVFLVGPFLLGKMLNSIENRRWKKKLKGISDRYMTDDERRNEAFHMKRFK